MTERVRNISRFVLSPLHGRLAFKLDASIAGHPVATLHDDSSNRLGNDNGDGVPGPTAAAGAAIAVFSVLSGVTVLWHVPVVASCWINVLY